jgi:hypothetical protein
MSYIFLFFFSELRLKHLVQFLSGETKDPGMALFRRYKAAFLGLQMDSTKFQSIDLSILPRWMADEAGNVLAWAYAALYSDTWPRADYKACLLLLIQVLGGQLKEFNIPFPPPDHHARWMSKVK